MMTQARRQSGLEPLAAGEQQAHKQHREAREGAAPVPGQAAGGTIQEAHIGSLVVAVDGVTG